MTTATVPTINEAEEALTSAMKTVKAAARGYVDEYGTTPRKLLDIINGNKSGWSGGSASVTNLMEGAIRECAIERLEKMLPRT